jgi:hypothetical protein
MNTPITHWINLTLHQAQRCHHLAWFLYGWLEREQVLTWMPSSHGAFVGQPRLQADRDLPVAMAQTQSRR